MGKKVWYYFITLKEEGSNRYTVSHVTDATDAALKNEGTESIAENEGLERPTTPVHEEVVERMVVKGMSEHN